MWFPDLYRELEDYAGEDVTGDVLSVRCAECRRGLVAHDDLRTHDPGRSERFEDETSWSWYALSRVHDWLILDAQRQIPGAAGRKGAWARTSHARSDVAADSWQGPSVGPDAVSAFFSELGFDRITEALAFHPFFHEIVALDEDPLATDCTITASGGLDGCGARCSSPGLA
ncbi:MAG: hypothetical protein WKG00_37785 [Polyangiaceae bacterium]